MRESLQNIPFATTSTNLDPVALGHTEYRKGTEKLWLLLSLPNYILWNIFLLMVVFTDYYLATICFVFLPEHLMRFIPIYTVFDIIYTFNFILLLLHRYCRKLKKKLSITVKTSLLFLLTDFVSILPQPTHFVMYFKPEYNTFILYFRLATALRLYHLLFFRTIQKRFQENRWVWILVQSIINFLIILHTANCVWYLVTNNAYCINKTYKEVGEVRNQTLGLKVDFGDLYFMTSYRVIQILLNVGFGDFYPTTYCQIFWFMITMLTGQFIWILFVGILSWLLISSKYHSTLYVQQISYVTKYAEDIDDPLKKYIKRHYQELWDKYNGVNHSSVFTSLPLALQMDVSFDINCGLLHRSLLLKDLPIYIQRKISLAMKNIFLLRNEAIYYQYVVKKYMVFLEKGVLEVLYDDDDHSPIISFKDGTILGEMSLFLNIPAKATVRATKYSQLKILDKIDFVKIMSDYPNVLRQLKKSAEERIDVVIKDNVTHHVGTHNLRRLKLQLYETNINSCTDNMMQVCKKRFINLYRMPGSAGAKRKCLIFGCSDFPWVLKEDYLLLRIWKLLLAATQIVLCLLYPYYAIFEKHIPYYLYVFGMLADVLCFVDIIMQCCTAVNLKDKTIIKISEIIDYRLDTWQMYCDIFSLFPIEVWAYLLQDIAKRNRFYDLFKFNRLLRIWRVDEFFKLFQNNITRHSPYGLWILKSSTYMFFFTYYSSCMFYLNACLYLICDENCWFQQTLNNSARRIHKSDYEEYPFLTSVYFAIMSTCHAGLGDILATSYSDFAIAIFIICMAGLLKSYCIAQLVSSSFLSEFCKRTYKTSYFLKMFFQYFQVARMFKFRLKEYMLFYNYFYETNGKHFLEKTAPSSLSTDLQMSKNQSALSNIPLFTMMDTYFLTILEKEAKTFKLPLNEILYYFGDPSRQMFVLQKGYCELYTSDNKLEKTLGPGSEFGAIEMMFGIPKQYAVVAITDCVLTTVDYISFSNILKLFPKEFNLFKSVVNSEKLSKIARNLASDKTKEADLKIYSKIQVKSFINTNWSEYWKPYRKKLGCFWFLGLLLMPVTIHPEGNFLKAWCTIRCCMIVVIGLVLPVIIMAPPFADELHWLLVVCQTSLYLDMYILAHVAYYNKKRLFKTHPVYTAWYYITHSFLADLIAAFPVELICMHVGTWYAYHYTSVVDVVVSHSRHCMWKLITLIQFHRIFQYLNYLEIEFWKSKQKIRIIRRAVVMILFLNVLTSVLFTTICNYEYGQKFQKKYNEVFYSPQNGSSYYGKLNCDHGYWVQDSVFFRIPNHLGQYMVGVYSIANFITNTGLGEVTATLWPTMAMVTLVVLVGLILFADLFAVISTTVLHKETLKTNFRKHAEHLMKFLNQNNVSKDLQKQVANHLEFIWEFTKGVNYTKGLLDLDLSDTLTQDILLNQYKQFLVYNAVFNELDDHDARLVVKHMRLKHFRKGETIIKYRDVISEMYIIISGQVELLNDEKYYMVTLGIGGTFGNMRQRTYNSSPVYVVARRNVALCAIPTAKFFSIIKYHPRILRKLERFISKEADYIIPCILPDTESERDLTKEIHIWNEIDSDDESVTKGRSPRRRKPPRSPKPNQNMSKVMDHLVLLASFMNIYYTLYVFVTQDRSYWCYSYLLLEPVFYIRVLVKLRQSYINVYGNFIRSRRKTVRRYLNNQVQVLWDVISNLPIALVCFTFPQDEWFFVYTCMRLLHLMRFYYIRDFFKVQEETLNRKVWLVIANLLGLYFIIIHFLSCAWLMIACPFDNCNPRTWIFKNDKDILQKPPIFRIILSYYYIISTITNTAIGDVMSENFLETIVSTLVMLLGKIMAAVLIGGSLRTIYYANIDLFRFQNKEMLLKTYLCNLHISEYQMRRIETYIEKLWKYDTRCGFPKLLHNIPYALTCDIMTTLYGHHLRECFLFKSIEETLLKQICSKLNRMVFFKNDYIVKYGDTDSCMYFIHQGNVDVLTKHPDLTETVHVVLHPNDMFGVSQSFNQTGAHHFTYRAATNVVEVLILSFQSWSFLLPHFPQDEALIFTRIQRQYTKV